MRPTLDHGPDLFMPSDAPTSVGVAVDISISNRGFDVRVQP